MSFPGQGSDEPRPAGPVSAGDPPPPPVAKASSGEVPPTEPPPGGGDGERVEEDLNALLADAEAKKDEYLEIAKRTQADFENYRKRMAAEVQGAAERGKAALVGELVHVVDNLERALSATGIDPADQDSGPKDPLAHGILLSYNELLGALKGNGVEVFDPVGEKFDPSWHEALTTRTSPDSDSGIVVETLQKGYRLGGQLIRPARVVVSE